MAYRRTLLHGLVAVGFLAAVGACVDTPVDTPAIRESDAASMQRVRTTNDENLLIVPEALDPLARYIKKPHAQDYWIKQWIGTQGGVVDFLGFRIIVPAGAVTKVTKFEIRIPGSNDPNGQEHVWAEFGPHNVNFRTPVTIELPYQNTTAYGYQPGIRWYNRRTRLWEVVGGSLTADSARVAIQVNHFSEYGTDGGGGAAGSGGKSSF